MGQFIKLNTVDNFQSLSNLKNKNGQSIKDNILFRSGHLHDLSNEEMLLLKNKFHIKTVIDFRSDNSFNKRPDNLDDSFNLFHIRVLEYLNYTGYVLTMETEPFDFLKDLYFRMATKKEAQESYKKYFDILLNVDGPFLVHCTSGKDRTGIAIDLLLAALDFSEESIVEEHMSINKCLEEKLKNVLEDKKPKNKFEFDFYDMLYSTKKEFIEYYFSLIKNEFGSIKNYLNKALDLNEAKINKLKKIFLE